MYLVIGYFDGDGGKPNAQFVLDARQPGRSCVVVSLLDV